METCSNGASETGSDDELEETEIERLVGVDCKADDAFDTCQAAGT